MSDINNFIDNLAKDIQPVSPLKAPHLRLLPLAFGSLLFVIIAMQLIQPFRLSFTHELSNIRFGLESLFAILSIFSLSLIVLRLSIPGIVVSRTQKILAVLPFILFVASVFWGHLGHPSLPVSMAGKRPHCFNEVLVLSWVPIFGLLFLARRAYPQIKTSLFVLIGIAGASLPAGLMNLACMYVPEHILKEHIAPVAIVAAATVVIGHFFVKRR